MEPVGQAVANITECMSLCVSVPGCAAVVFVENQKKCYPKRVWLTASTGLSRKSGFVVGPIGLLQW